MRRLSLILPFAGLLLLGQGCLADPPRPNRPIVFDYFKKQDPAETTPGVVSATNTRPEPPALNAGETESPSRGVVISSITANQVLPNPFVILGRAVALENTVHWRVRDGRGATIASGSVLTDAPNLQSYGAFRVRAFYEKTPDTADGRVELFTVSPGGLEQDVLSLPVRFEAKTTAVKVFYLNQTEDPQLLHCDKPYPVTRRIPKTVNAAEASLLELVKGPSAAEQGEGFRTAVLPGTTLLSVTVEGDTAKADFSRQFALGIAGSCNVAALRAQVEQTLKQFPNVKNVKILVEGADAEQYLQP